MVLSGKTSIIGLVKIPVRFAITIYNLVLLSIAHLMRYQTYLLSSIDEQDEAGTAAIKTVELDAALGGRGVQYREVQGNETEKFLSYFKPCIIPEEGGVASGFRHAEVNAREHVSRLFVCRGKHTVHVKEANTFSCVPCKFFQCILSLCPFMVISTKYVCHITLFPNRFLLRDHHSTMKTYSF
jgi:hypothetical protein